MKMRCVIVAGLALSCAGMAQAQDLLGFFTMNGSIQAAPNAGNTFMGQTFGLGNSAIGFPGAAVTGVDNLGVNISGNNYSAGTQMRLNVWLWDSPSFATSGTTQAFSNLLTQQSFDVTLDSDWNSGTLKVFENPTDSPFFQFTSPVAISDTIMGITFNWQVLDLGTGEYTSVPGLTTGIRNSGSFIGALPNPSSYYRNASATSTNGNFLGSDNRNINAAAPNNRSALAFAVWAIPTPGAAALLGLGGLVATRRRR